MERLNLALSNLHAVEDGRVSRSRVEAVSVAVSKSIKAGVSAGEIADALAQHCQATRKSQRLAALYALHAIVVNEKKALEAKNGNQTTEKRGPLSIALEPKIESIVIYLGASASEKDREQIGKILHKWMQTMIFPLSTCKRMALATDCVLPSSSSSSEAVAPVPAVVRSSGSGSGSSASIQTVINLRPTTATTTTTVQPAVRTALTTPVATTTAAATPAPPRVGWGQQARVPPPAAPAAIVPPKRSRWDA